MKDLEIKYKVNAEDIAKKRVATPNRNMLNSEMKFGSPETAQYISSLLEKSGFTKNETFYVTDMYVAAAEASSAKTLGQVRRVLSQNNNLFDNDLSFDPTLSDDQRILSKILMNSAV